MSIDTLSLGPVPGDESCQQLGPNYEPLIARAECQRYIDLIRVTFGPEPEGARLRIKSNPHDFGSYLDVVVTFDDQFRDAVRYAFAIEGDGPETWDDTRLRSWKE